MRIKTREKAKRKIRRKGRARFCFVLLFSFSRFEKMMKEEQLKEIEHKRDWDDAVELTENVRHTPPG